MTTRLEKLEAMLADDPRDQTLRYMLAMELDKLGDHDRSLDLFTGLMNDTTPHVPSFLMAGQLLVRLDRTEEARGVWQTGIQHARDQGNDHAAGEMSQFLMDL
ncbi:MAG: hypothetical protein R3C59_04215 [Planctomycetaceae bacterium]